MLSLEDRINVKNFEIVGSLDIAHRKIEKNHQNLLQAVVTIVEKLVEKKVITNDEADQLYDELKF